MFGIDKEICIAVIPMIDLEKLCFVTLLCRSLMSLFLCIVPSVRSLFVEAPGSQGSPIMLVVFSRALPWQVCVGLSDQKIDLY